MKSSSQNKKVRINFSQITLVSQWDEMAYIKSRVLGTDVEPREKSLPLY